MILEILFLLVLLLGVFILFYRQAIEQYNILQIDGSQISELPKLLGERTPVVVRDIGQPKLFVPELLKTNKRLLQFPLGSNLTVGTYIANPKPVVKLPKKAASLLAKESGLSVWAEHTWLPRLVQHSFLQPIHSLSTEAFVGEAGLRKTTGIATVVYPTAGALEITLLTEQQGKCLPPSWRGRFPETFTLQDTPLVGEIKYITVKLRPGTVLCIPTHWFYSIRIVDPKQPALWSRMTLDNPVSWIASSMESSLD
jgi:hypothetical protein